VVHTPPDGPGSFVALRQSEHTPSIRGDLKCLNEWEHEHGNADWNGLKKPTFDEEGNNTKIVSGTNEDSTMAKLMRDYDRRTLDDSATPESKRIMALDCQQAYLGRLVKVDWTFTRSSP
jgi:hypothetical protein